MLSIFVDSKDLLPDVAMMNLSGTPCFESQCLSLSPNGLYRCQLADELSLQLLEDCKALRASSSPNWPSQPLPSLLDLSVTVTLGLQLFVFVHDFLLERSFSLCFSHAIGSSLFSFFFPVVHACASCRADKKSDTARCHSQREVNVIRRPLPQATGRTCDCLHASCRSKCMRDVTEHVGTITDHNILLR